MLLALPILCLGNDAYLLFSDIRSIRQSCFCVVELYRCDAELCSDIRARFVVSLHCPNIADKILRFFQYPLTFRYGRQLFSKIIEIVESERVLLNPTKCLLTSHYYFKPNGDF